MKCKWFHFDSPQNVLLNRSTSSVSSVLLALNWSLILLRLEFSAISRLFSFFTVALRKSNKTEWIFPLVVMLLQVLFNQKQCEVFVSLASPQWITGRLRENSLWTPRQMRARIPARRRRNTTRWNTESVLTQLLLSEFPLTTDTKKQRITSTSGSASPGCCIQRQQTPHRNRKEKK